MKRSYKDEEQSQGARSHIKYDISAMECQRVKQEPVGMPGDVRIRIDIGMDAK